MSEGPAPNAEHPPVAEILDRARQRAANAGRSYQGDVTPVEAWILHRAGAARLIDVRTVAEWTFVGRVPDVALVEWRAFGAAQPNPDFIRQLREQVDPEVPVMLLCRSGVRSQSAATRATEAGWRATFNVLEGFEGDQDGAGRRGGLGGWRHAGLPWTQS
jgi:rhodanese-related sulfurtransferase